MSASPEMVALVDAYLRVAIDSGPASARTKATLLAAIAEIEAARDEVTRRLAALVGAVNVALADLDAPISEARWRRDGRGGQHVLYTGPLASVCHVPNVLRDLERIAEPLRAALPANSPTEKP